MVITPFSRCRLLLLGNGCSQLLAERAPGMIEVTPNVVNSLKYMSWWSHLCCVVRLYFCLLADSLRIATVMKCSFSMACWAAVHASVSNVLLQFGPSGSVLLRTKNGLAVSIAESYVLGFPQSSSPCRSPH